VSYVNGHGGINGHPIDLVACGTTGAPDSSSQCANTLIAKKVAAAVFGIDVGGDAALKPLKEAGIPIFGVTPSGSTMASDPAVTFTSAPLAMTYNGVFKVLKQVGSKKPVLVAPDGGAAYKKLFDSVLIPGAKAAGLDMSYSLYNPASPDFAAAISAVKKKGGDAIYLSGAEGDCTNGVKTARQLGWDKPLFAGFCTQFLKTLGSQAAGVYTTQYLLTADALGTAPETKKPQIQLYIDQMTAAGAKDKVNTFATEGFSDIMTITDALKGVSGDVTAATAGPVIKAYKGDVFLGASVDCAARPMPGGSCGTTLVALKAKADGTQEVLTGDFLDISKV
jgi:branched-chain amino acid transport system substrate-binding protein